MALDRYRELVPDWEAFLASAGRPEPTTLRVRTARISPGRLAGRLAERGFRLEPVEGLSDFLRVIEAPHRASQTLEHWLGLFYIQQAVTGLAAPALDPRRGERILDLCAAPGGKTTHVADLLETRSGLGVDPEAVSGGDGSAPAGGEVGTAGCLVAADRDEKRLRGLLGNVYRQGHARVLVVSTDGRSFPSGAAFDRVLVDVPCTAEGNLRRHGGEPIASRAGYRDHVTGVQETLLRRAIGLTRPGGTVLYVTCTFAPEENEGVVDRVLREEAVAVVPIDLEAPHAPGLAAFGGRAYDPSLRHAWRLYPHHLDSGGLFMARLRVRESGPRPAPAPGAGSGPGGDDGAESGGGASERGWTPVPVTFPDGRVPRAEAEERVEAGIDRMARRFGVPEAFLRRLGWMVRKDSIWVHECGSWPLPAWRVADPEREVSAPGDPGDWRFLSLGIRALKQDARFGERPTNDFLRWLGPRVRSRQVRISAGECRRLLDGAFLPAKGRERGIVALELEGWIVGRGVVTRSGLLRHEIPKGRAKRLAEVLDTRAASAAG